MAFQLVPFPISIIFALVFGVAVIAVLWRLRKRGKFFLILFYLSLIIGVAVFALLFYSIATGLLNSNPQTGNLHQPILSQNVTQIILLFLI